jgi:hypothetical protein
MIASNERFKEIRRSLTEMINAPGFAEEISRQSALIRASPDEAEALDFIEAIMADWGNNLGWTPLEE